MKRFLNLVLFLAVLFGTFYSCNKEKAEDDQVVSPTIPGDRMTNPEKISWVGPLSIWRIVPAVATAGSKIFFAGGLSVDYYGDISGVYSRVDIYDFRTGKWSTSQLSQERYGIAAASAGNKLVFAGGVRANGNYTSRVDNYDIVANKWTTAELSEARESSAVTTLGNKIFFGGVGINPRTFSGFSDRVDIYDVAANTWSTATLSEPRNSIVAAAAGNKVMFAGGYNGNGNSSKVDIYDASANTWSFTSLSETSRVNAATTVANTIVFARCVGVTIVGAGGSCANRVDKYDVVSETWSIDSLTQFGSLGQGAPHMFAGAASVGNVAVFFPSGRRNFIFYNSTTSSWALTPELHPSHFGESVFVTANNQIYISDWEGFGGFILKIENYIFKDAVI